MHYPYLYNVLVIINAYLFADFLAGVAHWIEDTYDIPHMFLCGNRYHHIKPQGMLKNSVFSTIDTSLVVTVPLILANYFTCNSLFWYFVPFFASFGNLIHKWAHTPHGKLSFWVRWLQHIGVFSSHSHHQKHHKDHISYYCPMSDYVNPFLEIINFWRFVENIIWFVTGITPRNSSDIKVVQECHEKGYLKDYEN